MSLVSPQIPGGRGWVAAGLDRRPGLHQDDTGHDVRAEAKELMAQGLSPADVTTTLTAKWADVLGDEDVHCAFARVHRDFARRHLVG